MNALLYCAMLTQFLPALNENVRQERESTCILLVNEAERQGEDPFLVTALSWHESRMQYLNRRGDVVRSHRGAVGPLQVIPRIWCESRSTRDCDLVEAGVRALNRFRSRFERKHGLEWAICSYNSGRCKGEHTKSFRWAKSVVRASKKYRRLWRRHSNR
jgi:hypothetical protein